MLLGRSDGHEAIERPQTRNIVGIEDSQFINKCFLPSATWACSGWVHRTRLTAPSSTFRVTAHPSTLVGWGPGTKWSLNPKGCVQSKPHVIRAYSTYLIHNRQKTLFLVRNYRKRCILSHLECHCYCWIAYLKSWQAVNWLNHRCHQWQGGQRSPMLVTGCSGMSGCRSANVCWKEP